MGRRIVFPFPAVIGQDKIKRALILNLINPRICGVLICGEKGTAKSTLVRGLAELCCQTEVVDLPLNVTEDRLVGTINIEKAISQGKKCFEGGILEKVHNNILYVDEVNLLSEHIVNCLLESAVSGINRIEREGISYTHPSEFTLVGTMNPEEGPLKPQFLDRFGLYVEVKGSEDVSERVEIIKRRMEFEKSPEDFIEVWKDEIYNLKEKIKNAKESMKSIKVREQIMNLASQLSMEANCQGHRAELVIVETAKAIAALEERKYINMDDVKEAAELALPHRMRDPSPDNFETEDQQKSDFENNQEESSKDNKDENNQNTEPDEKDEPLEENNNGNDEGIEEQQNKDSHDDEMDQENNETIETSNNSNDAGDEVFDIGNVFRVRNLEIEPLDRKKRNGSGRRCRTKTDTRQGRYIRYTYPKGKIKDLAFDATLRAAAPYQNIREKNGNAFCIYKQDMREKVREKRTGSTILFVVDASGSMGAKKRMSAVKGAVLSLLTDAYQKRDKVGMIAFRKDKAELLLGITRSVDLAQKKLVDLPTGGKTPLGAGLIKAYEVLRGEKLKNPDTVPIVVLVSDGRTNKSLTKQDPMEESLEICRCMKEEGIQALVVDSEEGFIKLELAKEISDALGAKYYKLEELNAGSIASAVRNI